MSPDQLAFGFIQYVVFLLSTTCHEAAHALVAKMGGDLTAMQGGQVSLNPIPHIRREPFGMVVMPLLGIVSGRGLIGWASTPYNPAWSRAYPKRAAWMSLAGPATNFALAILAAILMRLGLAMGVFVAGGGFVAAASTGGLMEPVAVILSVFFSLNVCRFRRSTATACWASSPAKMEPGDCRISGAKSGFSASSGCS
jgi:hypothetical protein